MRTVYTLRIPSYVTFALLLLILAGGCLPSGCNRTESKALFPSDSLSRQIAAQTPVDTLQHRWTLAGTEPPALENPRTVRFGTGDSIYVSDMARTSIFVADGEGAIQREITDEGFAYPYLAGWRGDTLVVYNPEAGRLAFLEGGTVARRVPTPDDVPAGEALTYVAATDSAFYFKALGEGFDSYLARFGAGGRIQQRWEFDGPYWRYAGLLRPWGDSLLSFSGYRPVVDVLRPGGTLDTLALRGFDSPMLARSRSFVQGDVDQPPLLTASADPVGDRLFVLNMRPGWLRVDVYDRQGQLQRTLVEPDPGVNRQFFPVDLAVRRAEGSYELAIVTSEPQPQLALYRWSADSRSQTAAGEHPSGPRSADRRPQK